MGTDNQYWQEFAILEYKKTNVIHMSIFKNGFVKQLVLFRAFLCDRISINWSILPVLYRTIILSIELFHGLYQGSFIDRPGTELDMSQAMERFSAEKFTCPFNF